jgi:hypothetical protein
LRTGRAVFGNAGVAALLTIGLFVLAAALVGLGVALVLLGLPLAGRRWRRWRLVAGALVLGMVGACTVALSLPPPRVAVAIDLADGREAARLDGGGGSRVGDMRIWEGDVELDLRLPGGRGYAGKATLVTSRVEAGRVRDVSVSLPPMSIDEAHARAGEVIEAWGLARGELDGWRQRGGAGRFGPEVFATRSRGGDPSLGLEIRRGSERWSIRLDAYWES